MDIENDEMFVFPLTEETNILYSSANDRWAIETPEDSFSVDEESFEEDIVIDEFVISLSDFLKAKAVILKRIEHAQTT